MKSQLLMVVTVALTVSGAAQADTKMTDIALSAVGNLNGIALHCKYIDVSVNIRKAAAETLPKLRQYGAAFEEATNTAFLDASRTAKPCPEKATFNKDVASAIGLMKSAFGKK